MPKPYSLDLRERVVRFVDEGHSRHAAAAHFRVSVSFVVNLVNAFRVRGSLAPSPAADAATPSSNRIGRFFCRRSPRRPTSPCRSWRPNWPPPPARKPIPPRFHVGSSASAIASKKTLRASEHDRPDIKQAREEWTLTRQPIMRLEPHRLVFLDETGTTTKMARLRGRSLKGQRLLSKVPFGHWKTQTFIAGLRCDALTAPFVIDAPMDRRIFETYVETQLAPTLGPGDVVVLDNLPAHKSAAAEQAVRAMGAWLLFLPPYSPDLNPIEMAFAKLKALLRARAVRTIDALWRAIGEICDLFSPQECQNYFHAAGYRLT
jgi:transposase